MGAEQYMRRRLEMLGFNSQDIEAQVKQHKDALLLEAARMGYPLQGWDTEPNFLNID